MTPTTQEILSGNPERIAYILFVTGGANVLISWTLPVQAPDALFLYADGGGFISDVREDFVLPTLRVWANCTTLSRLFVLEISRLTQHEGEEM